MNRIAVYLSLLFIFTNCNDKKSCKYHFKNLLENNKSKFNYSDDSLRTIIWEYSDEYNSRALYFFNAEGFLDSFILLRKDNFAFVYEIYDSKGNISKKIPAFFFKDIEDFYDKDSIQIKFNFYNLNRKFVEPINVLINEKEFQLYLKNDTIYSNMKSASIGFSYKGQKSLKVKVSTKCIFNCNDVIIDIQDSSFFNINTKSGIYSAPERVLTNSPPRFLTSPTHPRHPLR